MSVIVPNNEYQFTLSWQKTSGGKVFSVVMGLAFPAGGSSPSAGGAASALYDALTTGTLPLCKDENIASGWTWLGLSGFKMVGGVKVLADELTPVNGSGASNTVIINSAVLVKKVSALGGRKNRGRFYFPPAIAGLAVNAQGVITGSSADLVPVALGYMTDALDDVGLAPVIHHSDGSQGTIIQSWVLEGTVATQRRRLR
jgi:hypothetical protein